MKKSIIAQTSLFLLFAFTTNSLADSEAPKEEIRKPNSNPIEDFTYGFSKTVYDIIKESRDVLVDPEGKVNEYGDGLAKILREATPHVDIRYRYEFVNQDTKKEAKASTISTKLGLKTGKIKGIYGFVEGEDIRYIGAERFDNTINGKTKFAKVQDPDTTEINQAYIGIMTIPNTLIKFGRQTIDMGSKRFIGSQDWRQNETTYDAVNVQNNSLSDLVISYSYLSNQNNEFGDDSTNGDIDLKTNAVDFNYRGFKYSSITPYAYFIEDKDMQINSNRTLGFILNGKNKVAEKTYIVHSIEYANQKDYADNTNNFNLDYHRLSAGIIWKGLSITGGREILEGDGTTSIITVLGENHGYNGWTDKFSTIPANGLEDSYVTLEYKFKDINEYIDGIKLGAQYHDYRAENGGAKYGEEFDVKFAKDFLDYYTATVYYETYNSDTFSKDTDKVIGEISFKF